MQRVIALSLDDHIGCQVIGQYDDLVHIPALRSGRPVQAADGRWVLRIEWDGEYPRQMIRELAIPSIKAWYPQAENIALFADSRPHSLIAKWHQQTTPEPIKVLALPRKEVPTRV
jgi:hypothetical protein